MIDLDPYRWKNRLLLLFTPSASDERFVRQLALFEKDAQALAERDLIVMRIVGGAEERLREKFRVPAPEFALILVGKDGGEKHRWSGVTQVDQISALIDGMPMRREEMKEERKVK